MKKYGPPTPFEQARLLELVAMLAADGPVELAESELRAIADYLVREDQPELLARLHSQTSDKAVRKIINQALYRMKKRGVAVPEVKPRPRPVDLTQKPADSRQPILVSQPELNGERLFYFPWVAKGQHLLVQAAFHRDQGLAVLRSQPTSRTDYQAMVKGLTSSIVSEPPSGWVIAGDAMIRRKLWEIGTCVRSGKMGPEVERALVAMLTFPRVAPQHPAFALELDEVQSAASALLWSTVTALRPISDEKIFDELARRIKDQEQSVLVLNEHQKAERTLELIHQAVNEEVETWGIHALVEVFLDTALVHHLKGQSSIAKSLRMIVTSPREETVEFQVRTFLNLYLERLFLKGDVGGQDPHRSPSGIILV